MKKISLLLVLVATMFSCSLTSTEEPVKLIPGVYVKEFTEGCGDLDGTDCRIHTGTSTVLSDGITIETTRIDGTLYTFKTTEGLKNNRAGDEVGVVPINPTQFYYYHKDRARTRKEHYKIRR
jgi:hypothetical protein